eukprot:110135_1
MHKCTIRFLSSLALYLSQFHCQSQLHVAYAYHVMIMTPSIIRQYQLHTSVINHNYRTARKRTPTRPKFISFYRPKESQTYELKKRRKLAVSKGKKYKQTAQKLHYEVNKLKNDLTFERKKNCELSAELSMIRDQKKQREEAIATLTNDITSLKLSLSETIQSKDLILDSYQVYYQQTHSVIDQLIQHEKLQQKLKCFIRVEENEAKSGANINEICNLSVLRVEFLDASVDVKSISFQWKRSYGTELMSIKNANATQYKLSADDIGSIIHVEVRYKDHPEYYQSAVLEHGAIQMHAACSKTVQENMLKIKKQQIEFEIAPDLSDAATETFVSSNSKASATGGQQSMILLFNKDKIKWRTHKNVTVDKEKYNDSMKMTLATTSDQRFSLKLSSSKKYVFLTRSAMERDNIAILLRSYKYTQRLRRNVLCELYVRMSNERRMRNYETLNKAKLTRDGLVSSNPPGRAIIVAMVNPEVDIEDAKDKKDSAAAAADIEAQTAHKKAMEKLECAENTTIAIRIWYRIRLWLFYQIAMQAK